MIKQIENLSTWRHTMFSWIGRKIDIVNISFLLRIMIPRSLDWSLDLTHFQSKSQQDFLLKTDKLIKQFIWIGKVIRTAKTIMKKSKIQSAPWFQDLQYSCSQDRLRMRDCSAHGLTEQDCEHWDRRTWCMIYNSHMVDDPHIVN